MRNLLLFAACSSICAVQASAEDQRSIQCPANLPQERCDEVARILEIESLRQKIASDQARLAELEGKPTTAADTPPSASSASLALTLPTETVSQETKPPEGKTDEGEPTNPTPPKPTTNSTLDGLGFGLGLALTYDLGDNDRVKEASLVTQVIDGEQVAIVRTDDVENVTARFLLESHYFFTPKGKFLGLKSGDWGIGPFVAVEAGSDPVIQALGGGIMIGFRRPREEGKEESSRSFNIGLGAIFDLDSQILGEGIIAGLPLPDGETEIRFEEKEQFGLLLMTSFAF